jgi:hypothetical protein
MGVVIGMFRELARLGVSRAAAFFYAVAVGVVANVVIAHFSPHWGNQPATAEAPPEITKATGIPVATALIAPKPAVPPAQTLEISAPAIVPMPPTAVTPANAAAALPPSSTSPPSAQLPPPDGSSAASLPTSAAMPPPPLKPAALPTAPVAAASPPDTKPTDKPANTVEVAAGASAAAPISLLPPSDQPAPDPSATNLPAADQPAPKPAKPGPGSGGLY